MDVLHVSYVIESRLHGVRTIKSIVKEPQINKSHTLRQKRTNPTHQVAHVTKFCTVVPNIFGYSMLNVILTALRILQWLLDFWRVCRPLH